MAVRSLRRIKEARRRAAETDDLMDGLIAANNKAYNDLFRTLMRAREDLAVQAHERLREGAENNGT